MMAISYISLVSSAIQIRVGFCASCYISAHHAIADSGLAGSIGLPASLDQTAKGNPDNQFAVLRNQTAPKSAQLA
jgi:hypothetical protein